MVDGLRERKKPGHSPRDQRHGHRAVHDQGLRQHVGGRESPTCRGVRADRAEYFPGEDRPVLRRERLVRRTIAGGADGSPHTPPASGRSRGGTSRTFSAGTTKGIWMVWRPTCERSPTARRCGGGGSTTWPPSPTRSAPPSTTHRPRMPRGRAAFRGDSHQRDHGRRIGNRTPLGHPGRCGPAGGGPGEQPPPSSSEPPAGEVRGPAGR